MNVARYRIIFYRTSALRCQACDYVRSMNRNHQEKMKAKFIALSRLGRELAVEHGKHLRDGVWELRVACRHHQHRFLYQFRDEVILVTNAFLKKSAKVPEGEIEKALRAMSDWAERRGWETV